MMSDTIHVYCIQESRSGFLKIGMAINPILRLYGLQCSNPFPLTLLLTTSCRTKDIALSIEKGLHSSLIHANTHGEWFDCPIGDVETWLSVHNYPYLKKDLSVYRLGGRKVSHYRGVSLQMKKAIDWLDRYPDMQGLSLRAAADVANVSYSTLNRAKQNRSK